MDHKSTRNGSQWKDNKLWTGHLLLLWCQLMAKGDSECSSHNLTPHFAGTERVPLGLRQTGGAAISAIIPASRTIARGWGSWRTPSQPSRSTQWKSGTHGGTRARGSRRVASGRTAQLWTIVKGEGKEEEKKGEWGNCSSRTNTTNLQAAWWPCCYWTNYQLLTPGQALIINKHVLK